ncbi:hypothetical protein JAAARDRAFT_124474 [Jaapia argillacea MUCL 33604]|uniref:SAC domain-containing protein n=1 Tax=Jaapia argillacea MUCL 33604 TaxID=933084 RepID=A0A067Q1W4_9AGAM|nr:hypothetical protein JAAARDRAFT_124474 [Jaapia argillacea MUCL 33604]
MKRLFYKGFKPPIPEDQRPVPFASPRSTNPVAQTHLPPKYTVQPVPHPCPHEHIALLVAPHGLLIRPHATGVKRWESHVRISWGKEYQVEEVPGDGESEDARWIDSVVVYGIVGILSLSSASYLLVISARSEAGAFLSPTHPVYGVKGVTSIPLVEDLARIALNTLASRHSATARPSLLHSDTVNSAAESEDDAREPVDGVTPPRVTFSEDQQVKLLTPLSSREFDLSREGATPSTESSGESTPSSDPFDPTAVAKTLANRLSFWTKFPKRQWPATASETSSLSDERVSVDTATEQESGDPGEAIDSVLAIDQAPGTVEEKHSQLDERVVRECMREFSKGSMYFAYNFDITRSLQHKQEQIAHTKKQNALLANLIPLEENQRLSPSDGKVDYLAEAHQTLPLWRRVDRQFWWNEWLSKPFVDAGLHSYVLPIMQGYYQVSSFDIPREPVEGESGDFARVEYIVVSRRSRNRAGLRYQRRGIDDDAHVANFVETETIVRVEREGISNLFSYVQMRGSIPLFWTQSGYSLKPAPMLSPERTPDQNLGAIKRHFEKTVSRYGPNTAVNLAEQQGKEGVITAAYRDYMAELKAKDAQYVEYDFHAETRGMKYENISKLIDKMQRVFEAQGYLWISNDFVMSQQKGVFRTNCIDCLDRTNVVQSAFARHVLDTQLGAVALFVPLNGGKTETDIVFNDVWANNGDAISRVYAGTSALKGDFTRTGKRDLGGMLNDGMNSLARMYTSTFSDWFCQAVIDYMLGYRTMSVFSEFLLKLQSSDPRDMIRLSRIRAEAIATSVSRILSEGERLLSGWTLYSPVEINTKISRNFEEKVVLLTATAFYIVSYDYTLDKVKMYTRIRLRDITGITKGAYILSPLEEASRDPLQNAGFSISWLNSHQDTRVTSYSVRNSVDLTSPPPSPGLPSTSRRPSGVIPSPSWKGSRLSRMLSNVAVEAASGDTTFVAFKALYIDPARTRRGSGSFAEPADDLAGATNCKEVVDLMVDSIQRACQAVGGGRGVFVTQDDVVSLAEAQKMTSVYTKMEYGLKRLLWLGG